MRVRQEIIWFSVVLTMSAVLIIVAMNFLTKEGEERYALRSCAANVVMFKTKTTLADAEQKCHENLALIHRTPKLREQ